MKKFFKFFSIFLVIILLAIILLPYLFKGKIVQFVKTDINKNFNAKIDFQDVDLTLIKTFPDFNLNLENLTIDGVNEFQGKRLLDVKDLDLVLDVKSVLNGEQVKINRIGIKDAFLNILVTEDGKVNYDIVKPDSIQSDPSKFNIDLKKYFIENSTVIYDDKSLGFKAEVKNLNHEGNGKLSEKIYELKTRSTVDTLTITYHNIDYLHKVKADISTDFDISGDYTKYTLRNTKALINDLPLTADGFVELKDQEIVLDINYKTENANIAQLLSLIPKEYMPDLKGVKTTGTALVSGYVKGHNTQTDLPGFNVLVDVKNASIQYPDLPEKVSNINLLTDVDFKGGSDLNTMTVDLPRVNFNIAGSNVTGKLNIKQPMTDPFVTAAFKSNLDFTKVKKAVKLEQINDMSGLLDADIAVSGLVSAMENQQVDKINAKGYFNLTNFKLKSNSFKDEVQILSAQMDVTPSYLDVKNLVSKMGENDFTIKGKVTNYLAYAMGKNEVLKGDFTMDSKYLNLNDFMSETDEKSPETPSEESLGIIKVPENLSINFALTADKLKYQKMDLSNVKGTLTVVDQEAKLSDVTLNLLGGTVSMSGFYNTASENANTNVALSLKDFGIKESAGTFETFQAFAPVLNNISGKFLSDLSLNVELDQNMNPVLKSVNAKGLFKTDEISANGINVLRKVAELLKLNELINPKIDKLNATFSIKDGTLTIKPNSFKLNGLQAGISGTFNLDKQLDLELTLDVPREKLGTNFNSVINNIASAAQKIDLGKEIGQTVKTKFKISGLVSNPTVKPILLGSEGQTITETVKEAVVTKVETVKNEALEKAQAEADKLIAAAQAQKAKLVEEAEKLALETKNKAKQGADELLKQAGDNPLKKLAAQTAADKMVKEGDKKALQIVETATKKGDDLIVKAQTEADALVNKARGTGNQ